MISKKVYFMIPVLILLLVSLCPLLVLNGTCTSVDETTLHIPGETQRTRAGNPVLVAGLWHYLNVTLIDSQPSKLSVAMYEGDTLPTSGERNENTYYEWEYDNGNWNEVTEYGGTTYSYINKANCKKTGNAYSFYIGIKSDVVKNTNIDAIDYDNWTLEIKADNTVIKNSGLTVEEPVIGFAQQSAEFYLHCKPFTSTIIKPDHTFGIINPYNIPFTINLTYTQFANRIDTTNIDAIIHPNSTTTHGITINTPPWPPGIITIKGSIKAIPMYVVQTGDVSLISTLVLDFPDIKISVGHSNYTIYESPTTDVVFQYEEKLDAEYDEIKDITAYISGNGNASITITCKNATILNVFHENTVIDNMPFTIQSTNTSEQPIITQIHFTQENTIAFINYEIEINGENLTFTTQITVGPKPSQEEKPADTTLVMIIIGICIIAVIGYMIYSQMKYRRR